MALDLKRLCRSCLSVLSDISAKSAASVTEEVEGRSASSPEHPRDEGPSTPPLLQKRTACRALHYKVHSIVCTKRSLDIGAFIIRIGFGGPLYYP